MTKDCIVKLIESVISPCNCTYKIHRERAAKRIHKVLIEHNLLNFNDIKDLETIEFDDGSEK